MVASFEKIKKCVWDLSWKQCQFQLLTFLKNTIGGPEVAVMWRSWLKVFVGSVVYRKIVFNVNEARATACNAVLIHSMAGTALKCLWHTINF